VWIGEDRQIVASPSSTGQETLQANVLKACLVVWHWQRGPKPCLEETSSHQGQVAPRLRALTLKHFRLSFSAQAGVWSVLLTEREEIGWRTRRRSGQEAAGLRGSAALAFL